ncbi:MAG: ATP-binding protein [Candidatus Ozemobacteraceae bacterium]
MEGIVTKAQNPDRLEEKSGEREKTLPKNSCVRALFKLIFEMLAMEKGDTRYASPTVKAISEDLYYQEVVNPRSLFPNGRGTCLDFSLLIAGCLEKAGLFPLIVFYKTNAGWHSMPGCWSRPSPGLQGIMTDFNEFSKLVQNENLVFVESLVLVEKKEISFEKATQVAEGKIIADVSSETPFYVINIGAFRPPQGNILPMGFSIGDEDTSSCVDLSRIKNGIILLGQEEKDLFDLAILKMNAKKQTVQPVLRAMRTLFDFYQRETQALASIYSFSMNQQYLSESILPSVLQSVTQSVSQPSMQSVLQSVTQSISQPLMQSVSYPISVNLATFIRWEIRTIFKPLGKLAISLNIPRNLPRVCIIPGLFRRVLYHLFSNAHKAQKNKKNGWMNFAVTLFQQEFTGSAGSAGTTGSTGISFIKIRVSDGGRGIGEKHLSDLFVEGKGEFKEGKGLGLFFCAHAMRIMGGTIHYAGNSLPSLSRKRGKTIPAAFDLLIPISPTGETKDRS